MKVFTESLTRTATITGYQHERSAELASARIRPAVLVMPGGGYQICSDREGEPVALAYLAEGFNAFVLRYAVGRREPWDTSFADAKAALAWLREHASDLDIDPVRIAAVGFSAGGHLAASLGTVADQKPDALVLGYAVTLAEFGPPIGKEFPDTVSAVTSATPPTFLFGSCSDRVVPVRNSLAFLSALAANEVPFESHIYLRGEHGPSLAKPLTANGRAEAVDPVVAQWLPDSVRFLHTVLGDFALDGAPSTFADVTGGQPLGLDAPIGRLLADDRAAAVIERHIPGIVSRLKDSAAAQELPLGMALGFDPDLASAATLATLDEELDALN